MRFGLASVSHTHPHTRTSSRRKARGGIRWIVSDDLEPRNSSKTFSTGGDTESAEGEEDDETLGDEEESEETGDKEASQSGGGAPASDADESE